MASRGPPDASATNLIILNPMHLKDIAHVSSFEQIVLLYVRICVFLQFRFETRECHI